MRFLCPAAFLLLGVALGVIGVHSVQHYRHSEADKAFAHKRECKRASEQYQRELDTEYDSMQEAARRLVGSTLVERSIYSPRLNSCVVGQIRYSAGAESVAVIDLLTRKLLFVAGCNHPNCGNGKDMQIRAEAEKVLDKLER